MSSLGWHVESELQRQSTRVERRTDGRVVAELTPWEPTALVRPGLEVSLVNLARGGALVESAHRMHPGSRTELQLRGVRRRTVAGRIARCYVAAINPVRYRGVIAFDELLPAPDVTNG